MLKKLTEEQQAALLESATQEFGERGLKAATVASIARRSQLSVGVIYKYYADKNDLFAACLRRSMELLEEALAQAAGKAASLTDAAEAGRGRAVCTGNRDGFGRSLSETDFKGEI